MTSRSTTKIESAIFFFVFVVLRVCHTIEIRIPVNYTALTGDLEVHIQGLIPQEDAYYLQLLEYYPVDNLFTIIGSTPLWLDNSSTAILYKAKFPCGLIAQGGKYAVRIQLNLNSDIETNDNEIIATEAADVFSEGDHVEDTGSKDYMVQMVVRWPPVSLALEPQEIETYPESAVTASIAFPKSYCEPSLGSLVPETWISLIYCGHASIECKLDNISHIAQILYSEQIRGYPSLRYLQLNCNLFGQAGYYTLYLTSGMHGTGSIIAKVPTEAVLKAKWSERFVFNVHTRSIFQCDAHGGGVAVLFQYPDCILQNDKIRLFGSLRADVASSLPPTTLHYITEQKIQKGKYSLHFECDLFSEKYVEYCFVYVNQAITGAVSDVRMDCVPTFPVSDKDAGHWGSWSEWSECSSTCRGGTRSRYRFCDSPSPKYGAKYCEGHTVETQPCGNGTSWECQLYDVQIGAESLTEKPEITQIVGEKCRCGCIVHLDATMPQRFLATSLRNCSRKAWWKIQVDPEYTIQLYMNRVHFPCASQKLKIHDGEFISSNLLAQFTSNDAVTFKNFSVVSSTSTVLLEYSISDNLNNIECAGGFLCHFRQKANNLYSVTNHVHAESMSAEMPVEAVHVAISVMLLIVISMSLCMIIQYASRYHKYQRASMNDDLTDTDYSETMSKRKFSSINSHETSTSTLISEVIPLRKLCKEKELAQNKPVKSVDLPSSSSHSESDEISIEKLNDYHSEETKNLLTKEEASVVSEIKLHVFQAQVHVETEPVIDGTDNYQSPNSTNEEAVSESVERLRADELNLERRPSSCTRSSISSSTSPTLSSRTNAIESPNLSFRGSTLKRVKDIRNQERMMIGSDFSLTGHDTDLEIDYYDYNVQNTSAVPGSYLGMDPVYCVWIPPFAPGQWIDKGSDYEDDDIDSFSSANDTNKKMQFLDTNCEEAECRCETPHSEKFQKECKNKEKEIFKRLSSASTVSSGTKTLVRGDSTSEDDLTVQDALLPDSPVNIQRAYIIKDSAQTLINATLLEEEDNFKFADDDEVEEEDLDTAYNSENDGSEAKNECSKVTTEFSNKKIHKIKLHSPTSSSKSS